MVGRVIDYNEVTYVIRFTVPGYIEEAEAIPLNQWDRPDPDDEVWIFQEDTLFGSLYTYHKMGSRDEHIHEMQTDKFEVRLDEENDKLDIKFLDKFSLTIDLKNDKIDLTSTKSEVTLDVKKIHLGNSQNQPAVLGDEYEKRFKDLYKALASHTHGTSMGPSTPPLPPDLVKFQAQFPNTIKNDLSKNVDIMK